MADRPKYQFKSVQLLKDQSLGIGSYGAVCKAKCDDLLCAAKIIHPILFDPAALCQIAPQREHRLPVRRFEQECEFMSAIRHPNVVQYLGMFRDTDTCLSVLLMELMDDSLTHFLESSTQPILYHIQVNICHDIILALSFLHSNNIIHRDLSSNNILLIGNVRAKVADFGMARLGDINPRATHFTSTMCPGTDVYMPPEAVQDKPVYTEKIDCFSFGVITVQILTRQFPKPGGRLQEIELNYPGLPPGKILVQAPEINRRQSHISQVDSNHSLLPVALDCLKDKESERPSAHQLCERIADLKGTSEYRDSATIMQNNNEAAVVMEEKDRIISSKEKEIQQLRHQLQERDGASRQVEERERQLGQVNQQLRQEKDQADRQLKERERDLGLVKQQLRQLQLENDQNARQKEKQLGRVNQQLEVSEQAVAQFERQIAEHERQLNQREQHKIKASRRGKEPTSFKLRWRGGKKRTAEPELEQQYSQNEQEKIKGGSKGKKLTSSSELRWKVGKWAPFAMYRKCDAVVDGNMVYVINCSSKWIYLYDVTSDSWSHDRPPDCVHENSSITTINGWLTTVGGGAYTNELFSLTVCGGKRIWTKKFPPMPTKRRLTTVLCTETTLIVAGGEGQSGMLSTVEVMDTQTHQWSTVADLPQPMFEASATICGDQLYLLGETNRNTQSLYVCLVRDLLQSRVSVQLQLATSEITNQPSKIWSQIVDVPVKGSTCESFYGRLLVIGGSSSDERFSRAIYMYDSGTNTWEFISHMTIGRRECFTAVLPDNQLMVVGGWTDGGKLTKMVELASVCE